VGDIGVHLLEEVEVFLVAMTRSTTGEKLAGSYVQSGKKRRGPMAYIDMSNPFGVAKTHRKQRLGPVQCLDLAFSVYTQDHGLVGWVQIQPDDIPDFLYKERIR